MNTVGSKCLVAGLCVFVMASPGRAATYYVGGSADNQWGVDANWTEWGGTQSGVPACDNGYIRSNRIRANVANVVEDFRSTGSLHINAGNEANPFQMVNNGKSWTIAGRLLVGDKNTTSCKYAGVVFSGGAFCASSMTIGEGKTEPDWTAGEVNCLDYAKLENTKMSLSGSTAMTNGKLVLSDGATLETKSIYSVTNFDAVVLFDGGTLRRAACSAPELLRRSDGFHVVVGANGGTIDTAGRSVCIAVDIADATPDEPGAMNFKGGGTVCLNGAVGWTGGTTVEVGTCLLILDTSKAAILDRGLKVVVTDAWLDGATDTEIVRLAGAAGRFAHADLAKVRLPSGALAPVRLSADHRAIVMKGDEVSLNDAGLSTGAGPGGEVQDANAPDVAEHVATVNSNTSLSALFPASLEYGDMLVVNVGSDATLSIDKTADVCAVKFNVTFGKTLTLTGGELGAAYVWVNGGKVVVQNGYTASGMKVAELGRLLGNGTVAAAPGVSRCRFKDCSGFTGTLDAGGGDSLWRVTIKGGAEINPSDGGTVCILADATATADPSGLTVRGTLKVKDGATFRKDESGATSRGKFQIELGARLEFRLTSPNNAPQLLRQPSSASMIVE